MLKWKAVQLIADNGTTYMCSPEHPKFLDGNEILRRIVALPKKEPISIQEGFKKAMEEYFRLSDMGKSTEGYHIRRNWPDWLNQQGYHVRLTGDEYQVVPDVPKEKEETGPQPIQLTMRVGDNFIVLLTLNSRPPIKGIKLRPDQKLELLYSTGEMETAFKTAEERGYVISGILPGENSKEIKPFHWAS
jgi:hypothetical protein